jgi:prophage maintenance system killer protein
MRYVTLAEIVELHRRLLQATGGASGNGTEIDASVDEQERLIVDLATGRIGRSQLTDWLRQHVKPLV